MSLVPQAAKDFHRSLVRLDRLDHSVRRQLRHHNVRIEPELVGRVSGSDACIARTGAHHLRVTFGFSLDRRRKQHWQKVSKNRDPGSAYQFAEFGDASKFETATRLTILKFQEDLPPFGVSLQPNRLDEGRANVEAGNKVEVGGGGGGEHGEDEERERERGDDNREAKQYSMLSDGWTSHTNSLPTTYARTCVCLGGGASYLIIEQLLSPLAPLCSYHRCSFDCNFERQTFIVKAKSILFAQLAAAAALGLIEADEAEQHTAAAAAAGLLTSQHKA